MKHLLRVRAIIYSGFDMVLIIGLGGAELCTVAARVETPDARSARPDHEWGNYICNMWRRLFLPEEEIRLQMSKQWTRKQRGIEYPTNLRKGPELGSDMEGSRRQDNSPAPLDVSEFLFVNLT
ncbi:hypothetical protein J6590_007044 [Homalodisca vitripennis]|nr:hypothetical protein J6590_007044 [Homalodisca vitripennis]